MILEGEIKAAKMSSFSSDFQTLTLYFLYELLMSLRKIMNNILCKQWKKKVAGIIFL